MNKIRIAWGVNASNYTRTLVRVRVAESNHQKQMMTPRVAELKVNSCKTLRIRKE